MGAVGIQQELGWLWVGFLSEFCGGHLGLRAVRNLAVCAQDGFGSLRLDGC